MDMGDAIMVDLREEPQTFEVTLEELRTIVSRVIRDATPPPPPPPIERDEPWRDDRGNDLLAILLAALIAISVTVLAVEFIKRSSH